MKTCEGCGREFRPPVDARGRTRSRFCERLCAGRQRRQGPVLTNKGYLSVRMPEHPNAYPNGHVLVHRVVAEIKLGRFLYPGEDVHHVNGVKTDNRPENLCVLPAEVHRWTPPACPN